MRGAGAAGRGAGRRTIGLGAVTVIGCSILISVWPSCARARFTEATQRHECRTAQKKNAADADGTNVDSADVDRHGIPQTRCLRNDQIENPVRHSADAASPSRAEATQWGRRSWQCREVDARRCRRPLAPDVRLGEVRELKRRRAAMPPIRIQRWSRAALGWRRAAMAVQAPRTGTRRDTTASPSTAHTDRGQRPSAYAFGAAGRYPTAPVAWSGGKRRRFFRPGNRQHACPESVS